MNRSSTYWPRTVQYNATYFSDFYSTDEDLQTLQTEQNATRPKIRLMLPLIPLSRASTHPLPARTLSEINFTASKLNDQVPTTTAILDVWRGWTGKIISSSVFREGILGVRVVRLWRGLGLSWRPVSFLSYCQDFVSSVSTVWLAVRLLLRLIDCSDKHLWGNLSTTESNFSSMRNSESLDCMHVWETFCKVSSIL